ncbi:glycosyltransferase [Clavibacter sp. Sh2088]|uniref:glycosyltransferase n=1 Tax=Clavibacter sp. Sh2088 TaxID=3397676 RepID=UPI0039E1C72A
MRVLVLAFFHGLGHVVRATRVAEELRRGGAEVLVATAAAATHIPAARGLETAALRELPPIPAGAPPASPGARLRLADADYLRDCVADERELIRSFRPDFVLVDFRVTGAVSAALEGVHSGWIVNTGFFAHPFPEVLSDVVPQLIANGVEPAAARRILGDHVCIPDWSALDPLSSITDESSRAALWSVDEIRHVGPVLKSAPSSLPDQRAARASLDVPDDRPLVVVSLGGTAQGFDALRRLTPRLREIDATTAVVTGPNIDPSSLDTAGVDRVLAYTEEAMLWTRAADLVVTHGGHTSTMEAICVGTPLLAIPGHAEQRWNAARAVERGVGEAIDPESIESDAVPTIQRLLADPAVAARARQLAEQLAEYDGARELADHIRQVVTLGHRATGG